jgi:hypothetical protein
VYCRVPYRRAADQTRLDQRERACRDFAAELDVPVPSRHVFLDARAAAWHRTRSPRAFDDLIAAARAGTVNVLIVYGLDELARHAPADADELLSACTAYGLELHDPSDGRDWNDPAVREAVADEAERAGRAAREAAVAVRRFQDGQAEAGLPHGGGRRAFGYTAGYDALVADEAAVVREVFARFLAGDSLSAMAADLNRRGILAAAGGHWSAGRIARLLDAPRYAGLRIVRGQIARDADGNALRGVWPACVTEQDWRQARNLREEQARKRAGGQRARRAYLLTGLVVCDGCARAMAGSAIRTYRTYACSSPYESAPENCARHIGAQSLEAFVEEHALRLLEQWDPGSALDVPMAMPILTEAAQIRIVARDAGALDGVVTGPDARAEWEALTHTRRAAVLRFLFAAIRIGPKTTARSVFDESRVRVFPGPLPDGDGEGAGDGGGSRRGPDPLSQFPD